VSYDVLIPSTPTITFLVQESFLNSVVRVLFKTDPPGFFERSYPRLLEMNTWQSINQEILYVDFPDLLACGASVLRH